MPRFEPFAGIRYDTDRVGLADVASPPYDVISPAHRAELAARSPYNAVHVDLPVEAEGVGRYEMADRLLRRWRDEGVLVADDEPAFYVYRMGYHDAQGRARQTAGVIGALELVPPGTAGVLPHEHTTPKDKTDRLEMLRATRHNTSAVWGLSMTRGLAGLCELPGPPAARFTDADGVHHRLYRVAEAGVVAAIAEAVNSSPVVIADGHHRWETSLEYRDERRVASGGAPGGYDFAMAFVVELAPEQLHVGPIHRLLAGIDPTVDVVAALAEWFEPIEAHEGGDDLAARMDDAGALGLVLPGATWLLRPRPDRFADVADLDSARLDAARPSLGAHSVRYQHGAANVTEAVRAGEAQAAVLLRPVAVAVIEATARAGGLMPPKSTFFAPKPATGLVWRSLG